MKFKEPTSNTDISGRIKNDDLIEKNTILLILKTSLSLKISYVRILNAMLIMSIPHYYLICRL